MKTDIFIDSNAWDLFIGQNVDLLVEFPLAEFNLKITREAEFEISKMPKEKREYVEYYVSKKLVSTDSLFGFYDPSLPPDAQRNGGFGSVIDPDVGGRFVSLDEAHLIESSSIGPSIRPTGLLKNEADVSLAARSLQSFVITCDGKGVLKRVKEGFNGRVIDLKKFSMGNGLCSFIKAEIGMLIMHGNKEVDVN